MALLNDMAEVSFNPKLFLKDEDDIELCKDILKDWFHKIKVCHIENITKSWTEVKVNNTYPEQNSHEFIQSILSVQETEKEK